METYLVGGAVRDELLGRPVSERDWVVVGATAGDMLARGYRQVGRDFPVFLHPETGEEYALARTERKTGPGHRGFQVHADPSVTLEEDLARRDLTINAMARTAEGTLIDPHGGRRDLAARVLRHVSPAFAEDPLRVFRVARIAAMLPAFQVAEETGRLMREMAAAGELAELSAERVWAEFAKALDTDAPQRFIGVLRACVALRPWFAEFETAEPAPVGRLPSPEARYAAYVSGLEAEAVEALSGRLKAPGAHTRLAVWVARHRSLLQDWRKADVAALYQALHECRAFKPDNDLATALAVMTALGGRDLDRLAQVVAEIRAEVGADAFRARGLSGAALGKALKEAQQAALARAQGSA